MREQGIDKTVLYPWLECTEHTWLTLLEDSWNLICHNAAGNPVCMGWFNNINGKTAQCHFTFFKPHFDLRQQGGLAAINWLEEKLDVQALTGLTPKPYRQALNAIKGWGFELMFTLPQSCYLAKYDKHVDGIVSLRKRGAVNV